jgi:ABC-type multidrug transport system fused ATPase/permease subunit
MTSPIQNNSNTVSPDLPIKTIFFSNHRKAQTVQITEEMQDISQVFESLNFFSSKALINIAGSQCLEGETNGRMAQLFSRGIAAVAADLNASLIDNGISNKINKLLGQGVADRRYKSPLIGVCDANFTDQEDKLESNHSHFIFVDNQHLNYNDVFNKIIDYFSNQAPVLTILIGGDEMACEQVLHSVRQGFPIIILNKTGYLANELASLKQNPPEFISNPMHAEIIADGKLYLFESDGILDKKLAELQRLIIRLLRGDTTLRQAWERFAVYNANANRHQKNFRHLQLAILFLMVIGTGLALLQNSLDRRLDYIAHIEYSKELEQRLQLNNSNTQEKALEKFEKNELSSEILKPKNKLETTFNDLVDKFFMWGKDFFQILSEILRSLIIFIPIMITALLAAANRFNTGAKWLLLRESAQSVMREIFKYRTRADYYYFSNEKEQPTREERLAERLKEINNTLLQTDLNTSALQSYKNTLPPIDCIASHDDGISHLSPEQYLSYRLEDQYNYYVKKTLQLETKFKQLQWAIYIVGGIGTLLAAFGMEVWIALTSSLVAAFGTYLEYQQTEKTLIKYNRAALELNNVKTWWIALPASAQEDQSNIDSLVMRTEQILNSEFSDWIQEMQNTLSSLKEKQQKMLKKNTEEKVEKIDKIEIKQEKESAKL